MPERISALVFDLDNTLYTNADYTEFQYRILEERLAGFLGVDPEGARQELARQRAGRAAAGLPPTSLANLCVALGVDIATSVRWRVEEIRPAEWLAADPELARALRELASRYPLALVTNNPRSVGFASLEALGVGDFFSAIVGLDDTLASKPDPAPFILAAQRLRALGAQAGAPDAGQAPVVGQARVIGRTQAVEKAPDARADAPPRPDARADAPPRPESAFGGLVSLGDRYDVDLAPALALGMGAILVERVSEIYSLPDILISGP